MTTTIDTIDKAAWAISGACMLVGIVVLGLLEVLDGPAYGAVPVTDDAGNVVATPLISPELRTGLVVLGLVILLLWGLYRITIPQTAEGDDRSTADVTAD